MQRSSRLVVDYNMPAIHEPHPSCIEQWILVIGSFEAADQHSRRCDSQQRIRSLAKRLREYPRAGTRIDQLPTSPSCNLKSLLEVFNKSLGLGGCLVFAALGITSRLDLDRPSGGLA